jgi:hypothetical protein
MWRPCARARGLSISKRRAKSSRTRSSSKQVIVLGNGAAGAENQCVPFRMPYACSWHEVLTSISSLLLLHYVPRCIALADKLAENFGFRYQIKRISPTPGLLLLPCAFLYNSLFGAYSVFQYLPPSLHIFAARLFDSAKCSSLRKSILGYRDDDIMSLLEDGFPDLIIGSGSHEGICALYCSWTVVKCPGRTTAPLSHLIRKLSQGKTGNVQIQHPR